MSKSIKINFIFNIVNTVSSLLFPLIAFTYASRIIMAEGIGEVQFFQSIINYIVLFSSLGIPMYGIREIASVRDDERALTRTTIEIVLLNLILNVVGYIVVAFLCLTIPQIQSNISLFIVLSSSIILTTIGCSWFYNGIEDFKYITLVGLTVKTVGLIFLFSFVRNESDLLYYAIYLIIGTVGSNIINFIRLRSFVKPSMSILHELNISKHIKPTCSIFLFNIITSIYINLDSVMLGFLKDNTSVGYYTAATRVSHILVTLITSFGAVLLPRSSNLIKNNQLDEFRRLSKKSFDMVMMMAFPLFVGVLVCAPALIHLFCGESFEPSILTLQIVSPIIIALAISNLIGIQVLYPLGLIKLVTISTCIGACTNVCLNFLLIPIYGHYGAAIATVVAEFSVSISQCIMARKIIPFSLLSSQMARYVVCSLLLMVACTAISQFIENDLLNIMTIGLAGASLYISLMFILKDELALEVYNIILKKLK